MPRWRGFMSLIGKTHPLEILIHVKMQENEALGFSAATDNYFHFQLIFFVCNIPFIPSQLLLCSQWEIIPTDQSDIFGCFVVSDQHQIMPSFLLIICTLSDLFCLVGEKRHLAFFTNSAAVCRRVAAVCVDYSLPHTSVCSRSSRDNKYSILQTICKFANSSNCITKQIM